MPTLYSMVNETGNRNRILEMCKFCICFRLVHCGTTKSVTRCGFRQLLYAHQKCDRFHVYCFGNHKPEVDIRFLEVCGFQFGQFSGSVEHIRHRIGTKFRIIHCTRSSANAETVGYLAALFAPS